MSSLFHLLQRSYASAALEIVKLKALVPLDVHGKLNNYKGRIVEIVFDPLESEAVNARFAKAGYLIPDDMQVIAVTAAGEILLWGGLNSIYHLAKGEELPSSLEENLAFNDVRDLLNPLKLKNKKPELDDLIAKSKRNTAKVERPVDEASNATGNHATAPRRRGVASGLARRAVGRSPYPSSLASFVPNGVALDWAVPDFPIRSWPRDPHPQAMIVPVGQTRTESS